MPTSSTSFARSEAPARAHASSHTASSSAATPKPIEVVKKDIKNVHLSLYPPTGKVRISAPLRMNLDSIRVFAISKLGWIRQQQTKVREQEREAPREYLDRESHYVWGKRYLLKVIEKDAAAMPSIREAKKARAKMCRKFG